MTDAGPSGASRSPGDLGALVPNILRFVRLLRDAGLSVGPGSAAEAVRAVEAVGPGRREDFYWALHAVLVSRADQREIFDHAFRLFWRRAPDGVGSLEQVAAGLRVRPSEGRARAAARRLAEALRRQRGAPRPDTSPPHADVDLTMAYSAQEGLRTKDFEQMTADELELAREAIARMRLYVPDIVTRRWRAGAAGRVDMRATLRATLRSGHGHIPLRWKTRVFRPPALVVLCDVSGSMERYARLLLHFLHTLTSQRTRVSTFLFGTRLTNVTRYLEDADPDEALARVGHAVKDWSGGTRIGAALAAFNRLWSRRLLGSGAIVLLITDGLDQEGATGIRKEARRLRLSCRRLIWLNPLLRYEGFEPRAAGIHALLPEVDEMRPVHDLSSLEQLVRALSRSYRRGERAATTAP